jgi:hypothetical protein
VIVGIAVVVVVQNRGSDHASDGPTRTLREAAARSLAQDSFTYRLAGPGVDSRIVGVWEYQAPDRERFTPDPSSTGQPRLVISGSVLVPERSGRVIAYPLDNPHEFENLTYMLRSLSGAAGVTQASDTFVFDDYSAGHPIRIEVTIVDGLVTRVVDHADSGLITFEFSKYGSTTIAAPDSSVVDFPDPTACLPEGQQDPNVVCINSG